jgi:hypothetical protein
MIYLYDRLEKLQKIVESSIELKETLNEKYLEETEVSMMADMMEQGRDLVGKLKDWVAKSFPKGSTDPNAAAAKANVAFVLKWYLDMVDTWDHIVEKTL